MVEKMENPIYIVKRELLWKPKKDVLKNKFSWFDGSSVFFAGAVLKMIQKGFVRYEEFS